MTRIAAQYSDELGSYDVSRSQFFVHSIGRPEVEHNMLQPVSSFLVDVRSSVLYGLSGAAQQRMAKVRRY